MAQYKDCYDLAKKLPYFGIKEGKIYLKLKTRIIDFHTHLGISFLFAKPIDYLKKKPHTIYQFPLKGVPVLLDLYSGVNLYKFINKKKFSKELLKSMITSKGDSETMTIPNLLEEMDRFRIEKSVVLAIDLPFSSRTSREYLKHVSYSDRLLFFCFINPMNLSWRKKLKTFVEKGALGIKIHPYMMMSAPDQPRTMKVIKEWSQYELPVFFHCGYNGIEPSFVRRWAKVEKYERPIKTFPKTTFILGHSGSSFYKVAINLARKYENIYLDLNSQSPKAIKEIISKVDNNRLIFGSDWPFHPVVLPLAKVLLGTEGNKKAREKILYENANRLIGTVVTKKH